MICQRFPLYQRGAALIVGLLMLVVMTLIGVSAMQTDLLEEKMAGNQRDLDLAFQAAESTLRDGENWLRDQTDEPVPDANATNGVFTFDALDANGSWWETIGNWDSSGTAFNDISGVNSAPLRVIEGAGFITDGSLTIGQNTGQTPRLLYRITARGTGGTDSARAIVQTIYAKRF